MAPTYEDIVAGNGNYKMKMLFNEMGNRLKGQGFDPAEVLAERGKVGQQMQEMFPAKKEPEGGTSILSGIFGGGTADADEGIDQQTLDKETDDEWESMSKAQREAWYKENGGS